MSISPIAHDTSHILDEAFTLCRIPFVFDFLFTPDPVADISILTAPVQIEHATSARLSLSGSESTVSFAHVFDYSTELLFSAVPAFSVGAITLGFATLEPANRSPPTALDLVSVQRVQCKRFVRDDSRGVLMFYSEKPNTGLTEIECITHRSTRKRSRVCARFHTDTLRQNLQTKSGTLVPEELTDALKYLSVFSERRMCPVCVSGGVAECACVLPFKRPSHPLDFRNERSNMALHTGLYEGGCSVRLFSDMHPCVIANLVTHTVITGSLDKDVIARLNRYAVQDRLAMLKTSPTAGILSLGEPTCAEVSDSSVNAHNVTEIEVWDKVLEGAGTGLVPNAPPLNSLALGESLMIATPNVIAPWDEPRGDVRSFGTELSFREDEVSGTGSGGESKVDYGKRIAETRVVQGMVDKAERRRQRNREAAAKSNLKRKIRNETLRKNLKEVCKRAEELRERERVLRAENVRLRGLATEKNFRMGECLTHIQFAKSGAAT